LVIWVVEAGNLLRRGGHGPGRGRDLADDLPEVLDHLPHDVLEPADLVPGEALDVDGQVAVRYLLRSHAQPGKRVRDQPGEEERGQEPEDDARGDQDQDERSRVLIDRVHHASALSGNNGGMHPVELADRVGPHDSGGQQGDGKAREDFPADGPVPDHLKNLFAH
jgi:hypothetical protein